MQQKIQHAQQFSGYLDKKSPAMLKGWQRRFFQVRDSGKLLLYFAKDPSGHDLKPKGILQIMSIESLVAVPNSKTEFTFKLDDRSVHMRAQTEVSRQEWIETLTFLKELKLKEQKQEVELQRQSSNVGSGGDTTRNVNKRADWSDLDLDTMNRIKLEEEKNNYEKVQHSIEEKNEEVLRAKGIYPFITKYDRDVVDKHVICGFLMKKGKLAKLTVAKKRWFFMISSVIINGTKEDGNRINQADIPSVFRLDSMYYFAYDSKGDKSNFIGKIVIDECEKAELMSLDKNQFMESLQLQKLPYGLTLYNNKECRQYNFFSEHLTEVNKWINAITAVHSRPNKGHERRSKMNINLKGGSEQNDDPDDEQFIEEEILYETQVNKKHQNKLLTGPLSWKPVTLQLKKTTLAWTSKWKDKDENTNQYILLFNVTKVEGANKSWVVFTSDGEEYKFKEDSAEKKDEWVKRIQVQVDSLKGSINEEDLKLADEKPKTGTIQSKRTMSSDEEDSDYVSKTYYKKMEISMSKVSKKGRDDDDEQKPSFFSRIFGCCDGRPDEDDTDRGF